MLEPCVDYCHGLREGLHWDFYQVVNVNLAPSFFPDLEVFVEGVEQVLNLLLVDLVEGQVHCPVSNEASALLLLEELEYEFQRGRDYALAFASDLVEDTHRVGLSSASLAVNEVAAMVAVQCVEDQREGRELKHFFLACLFSEDLVELEILGRVLFILDLQPARRISPDARPLSAFFINLMIKRRPDPYENLHVFGLRVSTMRA